MKYLWYLLGTKLKEEELFTFVIDGASENFRRARTQKLWTYPIELLYWTLKGNKNKQRHMEIWKHAQKEKYNEKRWEKFLWPFRLYNWRAKLLCGFNNNWKKWKKSHAILHTKKEKILLKKWRNYWPESTSSESFLANNLSGSRQSSSYLTPCSSFLTFCLPPEFHVTLDHLSLADFLCSLCIF